MTKDKHPAPLPSGVLTFMFTDIVGSTSMKEQMPGDLTSEREAAFVAQIKAPHDAIITERYTQREGCFVKGTGDGFLIVFRDPEKAVVCALEIQEKLKDAALTTPQRGQLQVRIGLNTGPAEPKDGDYTASAVDKAKRVESSATPGEVFLSRVTQVLVQDKVRTICIKTAGIHYMEGIGSEELFVAVRPDPPFRPVNSQISAPPRLDVSPTLRNLALVGEADEARFQWLRDLLAEVYLIDAVQANSFEEVKKRAQNLADEVNFRVIFLADTLQLSPSSQKADPRINFSKLEEIEQFYGADFACFVTRGQDPNLEGLERRPQLIHFSSFPPEAGDRERIILELGKLRRIRPVQPSPIAGVVDQVLAVEKVCEWDHTDRTLRRQIRSLSERHELEDGYNHLVRLIRDSIQCDGALKIKIEPLGQGKSGAKVFHIMVTNAFGTKEYVLKLTESLWKLEREVRGYSQAQETTGVQGYRQHVAVLREPVSPRDPLHPEGKFIAQNAQWYAIHYDFLGGEKFGKFIDLETVLLAAPSSLHEKTKNTSYDLVGTGPEAVVQHRLKIFGAALAGLCKLWYGNNELGSRRAETIWNIEDAPEQELIFLPPYRLTRRVKGLVQDFLDSREVLIGPRLFSNWNDKVESVLKLVRDPGRAADLGWLGGSIPFTLSPVHGDLNTNNILLWLEHETHPFVIDLPSYQQDGHCLQDFARLEVEIKLALLDRQEDSPVDQLAAFDYSVTQVPLWMEMEDRLLESQSLNDVGRNDSQTSSTNWKAGGYHDNVELCYRAVMMLRQKAHEIQQKPLADAPSAVPFADEYLPALLYHSVNAIRFPWMSVFKRLLAVYTAGSIVNQFKQ